MEEAMLPIQDAVAVITGEPGAIGKTLAQRWLENGGRALLADVAPEHLQRTRQELNRYGDRLETLVCNVNDEKECARLADTAIARFGAIHLVAPLAGIIRDGLKLSTHRRNGTSKTETRQEMLIGDITLKAVFNTVRHCVQRMVDHRCKGLICVVSAAGTLGTAGQLNQAATQAARSLFPKRITAEFRRRSPAGRIRCVTVAPGYAGTDIAKDKDVRKRLSDDAIGHRIAPQKIIERVLELYCNEALAGEIYFVRRLSEVRCEESIDAQARFALNSRSPVWAHNWQRLARACHMHSARQAAAQH
jgi:3-oxoacyl-[acyl-carrier protein] reductase